MSERFLLDTNALVWFAAGEPLKTEALVAIANAQARNELFVSAITAWEVALALQKPNADRRPNLGGLDAAAWFDAACEGAGARVVNVTSAIAVEAARVVSLYRVGDPGDCHVIATAMQRKLTIVTRDAAMLALSKREPKAPRVIVC